MQVITEESKLRTASWGSSFIIFLKQCPNSPNTHNVGGGGILTILSLMAGKEPGCPMFPSMGE